MPGSLIDTSVWISAVFSGHPFHRQAQQVLQGMTPLDPAVFCRSTQQSFLRLLTTPALLKAYGAEGFSNRDALSALNGFMTLSQVCEQDESPGVAKLWYRLATLDTTSPKVWMDAYLAAFAIKGGLRLVSLDRDFKNFEQQGLNWVLLTGA